MGESKTNRTLINISKKTFVQVTILLAALLVFAIVLSYLVPKGEFGTLPSGEPDYLSYEPLPERGGIPVLRGIFAPVLVFFSPDGLTLAMLSLFLFIISAAFQVMNDMGGVRALLGAVSARFENRKTLLLVLISFLFYCFGSFLGLFEEMLTMLPIVAALCLMLGYDSFTGFLCCTISCGFGFAGAITNPFTVLLASQLIGVNPLEHIWLRVLVFIVMFALLQAFLFLYLRRLRKDPASSLTREHDAGLRSLGEETVETDPVREKRARRVYAVFLLLALALIIVCSLLSALRDYTVVVLIVYFLLGGIAAGMLVSGDPRAVFKSFGRGFIAALPTLVFIALAASLKYVLVESSVLPTVVHQIDRLTAGRSVWAIALVIYGIVLLLEFFISSSTAKAILLMGILGMVHTGLSRQMLVLLYTFGDGYTNVLFPTSPVLLLSLSMIGVDYLTWVKKSLPLFLVNLVLVIGFILLGVAVHY